MKDLTKGKPSVLILTFALPISMGFSLLSASEFLQTEKWRCAKQ